MRNYFAVCLAFFVVTIAIAQPSRPILPAAYRSDIYLPLLKGKRVGVFANHTATIGKMQW